LKNDLSFPIELSSIRFENSLASKKIEGLVRLTLCYNLEQEDVDKLIEATLNFFNEKT
tara:strand:+ start:6115 stop:6288 length:174 start_codon:yes stop_codon:yes gene_type:complete